MLLKVFLFILIYFILVEVNWYVLEFWRFVFGKFFNIYFIFDIGLYKYVLLFCFYSRVLIIMYMYFDLSKFGSEKINFWF